MKARLYAVLRSFNSTRVIDLIHRLSLSPTALASIIVVIDAKRDSINTPKLLREITCPFPIQVVLLERHGWSKALNAGIESLPVADAEVPEFVMPVSNEVMIEPEHVRLLLEAASQGNASCGYALFQERYETSYSVPRNTCAVWKRSLLLSIGLFDDNLDSQGGMEDYEMTLRAFDRLQLLPFAAKKRIGLVVRDPMMFPQKVAMEEHAIRATEARYSEEVVNTIRAHLRNQALKVNKI